MRETMEYDIVIVGAGPAGLAAAIRAKQIDAALDICVLEKGSEVGAHILSGAILDTIGLDRLIPDWQDLNAQLGVPVSRDDFYMLGEAGRIRFPNWPMPPLLSNHGNYIVSMGNVCRWLAELAEELDVEVYPEMACSELITDRQGRIAGVVAGEFGKNPGGEKGPNYEPGIEVLGNYTLLCEGARGSLSKQVIRKYGLDRDSDVPKFGLGMKEVWEIRPDQHDSGRVVHTAGWPLGSNAGGGSFIYHMDNYQVSLGFVVHLNYRNPHLDPYMEFQRFKQHPMVRPMLEEGKRVAYGARVISEGGWQSIPKVVFPGGALVGCSAGLVNVPRIKGNHNAMLSGIAAAEAACRAITDGRSGDVLDDYESELRNGEIGKDLKRVRNVKPIWSRFGLVGAFALGGLDMWAASLLGWHPFGSMKHGKSDAECTGKATAHEQIDYPKPDGTVSFDRTTNVSFSGTNHDSNQPCHLKLGDEKLPIEVNLPVYSEPAQRYCPAGVYEVIKDAATESREFRINFQNCLHCKTCDIKDPSRNITWQVPQGGDGPNYPNM